MSESRVTKASAEAVRNAESSCIWRTVRRKKWPSWRGSGGSCPCRSATEVPPRSGIVRSGVSVVGDVVARSDRIVETGRVVGERDRAYHLVTSALDLQSARFLLQDVG